MQIDFRCPVCQQTTRTEVAGPDGQLRCVKCEWSRAVVLDGVDEKPPEACLVCACDDLWRQKDFPQRLGVLLVGTGAMLSTIAWYYMMPILALAILMVFAAGDLLLYAWMKDVLVCYRCNARHRHSHLSEEHPRFNLETAERYHQEAIRTKDAENSTSQPLHP